MVLERLMGQFKLGDIEITGLADKHKCEPTPADISRMVPRQISMKRFVRRTT